MYIIRPTTITSAMLTSSTIPETDYTEYNATTTYAEDVYCMVAADHAVYQSLQAGNMGHTPSTSTTWWIRVSSTNRWKAFDNVVNVQSQQTETLSYTIRPGVVNSVALLNLEATNVTISMVDAAVGSGSEPIEKTGTSLPIYLTGGTDPLELTGSDAGAVYNRSESLINNSTALDWYTYFFEPIMLKSDFVALDIPPIGTGEITITVNNAGGTAKVGEIVVGMKANIGKMKYDPSVSIIDYSIKEVDDFGNYNIVERPYSKKLSCDLTVDNTYLDIITGYFAAYRAKPLVWIGSELFVSLIIYGFYKSFEPVIKYLTVSECALEIEGLI